ncbi:MAG: hypothetical protein ACKVTZ_18380 [Bacteroidia bacterium]
MMTQLICPRCETVYPPENIYASRDEACCDACGYKNTLAWAKEYNQKRRNTSIAEIQELPALIGEESRYSLKISEIEGEKTLQLSYQMTWKDVLNISLTWGVIVLIFTLWNWTMEKQFLPLGFYKFMGVVAFFSLLNFFLSPLKITVERGKITLKKRNIFSKEHIFYNEEIENILYENVPVGKSSADRLCIWVNGKSHIFAIKEDKAQIRQIALLLLAYLNDTGIGAKKE